MFAQEGIAAIRAGLPARTIEVVDTPSEGGRSTVHRLRATASDGMQSWLIANGCGAGSTELPGLSVPHAERQRRWGDIPLDLAPAFLASDRRGPADR